MPKPYSILTLSWEDVYAKFLEEKIIPTKEMIEEAFEYACNNSDNEYMMNGFWTNIEYAISEIGKEETDE